MFTFTLQPLRRMPKPTLSYAFALALFLGSWTLSAKELATVMQMATKEKAQALLAQEDDFIRALSPFDVQSRLGDPEGTKEELRALIPQQARDFSPAEAKELLEACFRVDDLANQRGWQLNFPDTVYFVKTTGKEEGNAEGYTRGNFIVLNEAAFTRPFDNLVHLVAHEAFHILSRHNPELRKDLYGIIGFEVVPPISLEALKPRLITNPDACLAASFESGLQPAADALITLETKAGKTVPCVMVTYAINDYLGGSFFQYLRVGFIPIQKDHSLPNAEGEVEILSLQKVSSSFFAQVGRNTNYTIHPEEILAENFVLALEGELEVKDEWVVERIRGRLEECPFLI